MITVNAGYTRQLDGRPDIMAALGADILSCLVVTVPVRHNILQCRWYVSWMGRLFIIIIYYVKDNITLLAAVLDLPNDFHGWTCGCLSVKKISDWRDLGAQNFNFAPKFPKIRGFGSKFCILDENFATKTKFSDDVLTAQNLGEGNHLCPSCYDAMSPASASQNCHISDIRACRMFWLAARKSSPLRDVIVQCNLHVSTRRPI